MAEHLPSIDYDKQVYGSESLFDAWETGGSSTMQAPLSVRRPRYRKLIVSIARTYAPSPSATVVSIGAGNGFTEAELAKAGFRVTATDRSRIALRYCREKGLTAEYLDFPSSDGFRRFDLIYCDGLLGHLWQDRLGYSQCWPALANLGEKNSMLIISNDLANTDDEPTFAVKDHPHAKFFRPPAGWFAKDAQSSGLWTAVTTRMIRYRRNGYRRREIVVLRRSLVDKGEK